MEMTPFKSLDINEVVNRGRKLPVASYSYTI